MDCFGIILLLACAAASASQTLRPPPSAGREAYFNGSSFLRMLTPISLLSHTGLSFRSCVGGELFSQRSRGYSIQLSALADHVLLAVQGPGRRVEVRLPLRPLDNRWHYVGLVYQPPDLVLEDESGHSVLVANATFNSEILTTPELESPDSVLVLGSKFSGCMLQGPSLVFNASQFVGRHVTFGHCPLSTSKCVDRKDVLRVPPKDWCYNEPCMRHGVCISGIDRYECHCAARYSGHNCQVDNGPPCASAPCHNGGHCEETALGDYRCSCISGFYGQHCEYETSVHPLCSHKPCMNNGTCHVTPASDNYVCTCITGFTGTNCEINIDDCLTGEQPPCQNGGICKDGLHNYTCDCGSTGYWGPRCENNIDECELQPGPCLNKGLCYDTYGSYVCHCQPGYTGANCQLNQNECLSFPCMNGGTCEDLMGSFKCLCPRGTAGARCQLRRGPRCADTDCPLHATCEDRATPVCVCEPGYEGAPGPAPNCTLRSESSCSTNPCANGGTCSYDNIRDQVNCSCLPGFTGVYCEAASMSMVPGEAPSARSSGPRCSDLPCRNHADCQDYPGGYYCDCKPGWTGLNCESGVNECMSEPCQNGGECTLFQNKYHCHCPPRFSGKNCQTPVDMCISKPCQNGGTCSHRGNVSNFTCECAQGFEGKLCELNHDDCLQVVCPEFQMCYDGINSYTCRCPDGFAGENCSTPTNYCAANPCVNGTCREGGANYTCSCQRGFTGRNCELDIDECKEEDICNHGICVNKPGSYQCYCKPGFTGEHCDVDFDECLSQPCKNEGSCINKINNYECICSPGFTGKDCTIDINECESNPCMAGSTCVDGMASFSCTCMEGLTGSTCEINIDDCESSPCLNGGLCEDGLNSYRCNCSDTGHRGLRCETNIDDCASNPCVNGAICVDGVKDYTCQCHPGYSGKNCEVDIPECESSPCQYRGVCLERSNVSLYQNRSLPATPVYVSEQLNMTLPDHFFREFSYENASGFECLCIPGIKGAHCETNINECELSPCGPWGSCLDGVGRYDCECEEGYEGEHCQREIDECLRYKPCEKGTCHDRRADYYCDCEAGWGGKNCSTLLQGCATNQCRNGGTCRPWLQAETVHRFNCTCSHGFHGTTCEEITTMSLGGHSYVVVNTSRDEGYDIQFHFKTTLGNGLLAIGKGLTFYILELVNGRLNLHSSLLNKWEGVFIGSKLNDSEWQKVFVAINSSHLVLAANEEQTIYPINLNEGSNSSHTSFPTTYLGGTVSSLSRLTHGPAAFVGCVQDVTINGEWVLPEDPATKASDAEAPTTTLADSTPVSLSSQFASWKLYGVQTRCPRQEQCAKPNPCHSGGRCTDLWTSFHCTCQRPYLGHTCQYNVTAATFGYENISNSLVTVTVHDAARRAVRSIVDISMFIRTRKPEGQIFYLGSKPNGRPYSEETFVAASLEKGELLVRLQFNQTSEAYTVGGGNRLDNGYNHLIQVVRNSTLVQFKLNGSEYFRKPISATGQLDAQVLYLGGQPLPAMSRSVRQADVAVIPGPPLLGPRAEPVTASTQGVPKQEHFKGIIQDVQISSGSRTMIVEFFPLNVSDLEMPASFGTVSFEEGTILEGEVSDDSCADNPCRHNGSCVVTWNDFKCECVRGYKGKACQEMEFCQLQDCPIGSTCRNLDDGYECVANATFDGRNNSLLYSLQRAPSLQTEDTILPALKADSISIMYRSKTGGTLLFIGNDVGEQVSVSVFRDQVAVEWRMHPHQLSTVKRFRKPKPNFEWTKIHIVIGDKLIRGGFEDWTKEDTPAFTAEFDSDAWLDLLRIGTVVLGSVQPHGLSAFVTAERPPPFQALTTDNLEPGSMLNGNTVDMAMYSTEPGLLDDDTSTDFWEGSEGSNGENFKGCLGEVRIGDLLLPYYSTAELYPEGGLPRPGVLLMSLRGARVPALGCSLCFQRDCLNGGHCADPAANYSCSCPLGYSGDDCGIDVNECEGAQCANGATCLDGVGNFTCACAPGWEGWLCNMDIDECATEPCENGGTCTDMPGGYSCACPEAFTGPRCSGPRRLTCAHRPCRADSVCLDKRDEITGNNFTCECRDGYEGVLCDMAYCQVKPCLNGGNCENNAELVPACKCTPGFKGLYCGFNIDDCHTLDGTSPCHGGRCTDGVASYTCDCHGTGYTGVNCDEDINECLNGQVSCGDGGTCLNVPGSYTCRCPPDKCGDDCSLRDPCVELYTAAPDITDGVEAPPNISLSSGPCFNGGSCKAACSTVPDYECHCSVGWAGKNCTDPLVSALEEGGAPIGIILGGVVGGLCALGGAALAAACLLARTKRATRGTYSPSGQEYRNPRLEMLDSALKPPPEERLI